MNALTAPLLHVQRSDALWLLPVVPVLGALVRAGVVDLDDPAEPLAKRRLAAAAPAALAALLLGSQLFALGSLEPDARSLFAPGSAPLNVGTFEASFGLALDPSAAVIALGIVLAGLAAQALRPARPLSAMIDLAIAGALCAVLADGFFGFLVGGVVASAALVRAAYADDAGLRGFFAARVGDVSLLLGAILLFWSLGGSWGIALGNEPTYTRHNPAPAAVGLVDELDSDEPDLAQPLYAVLIGSAPAASAAPAKAVGPAKGTTPDYSAKGSITLATAPGSRLFLKGGSEAAGNSPMVRHEVYAGRIDVEVERPGGKRVRFRALEVPPGREVALVPVGPTWSFRELRDQLALEDGSHQKFVRNLLDPAVTGHRRLGAWDVAHLLAALFGLAGLAWIASVAFADDVLLGSFGGLLGVYLLARLSMVVVLSPQVSALLSIAAAALALGCAIGAAVHVESRRVMAHLLATTLSLAALGAFVGSPALAVASALVAVTACALTAVTLERLGVADLRRVSDAASSAPNAARVLRVLAVALAGAPVPWLGASFGGAASLGRAFGAELPWAKLGWAVGALASVVSAWAVWRLWFLVSAGPARKRPLEDLDPAWARGLLVGVIGVAVLGPLAGLSRAFLGFAIGGERSLGESFLDVGIEPGLVLGSERAVRLESGRMLDLAVAFAVVLAAVAAFWLARRRFSPDDRPKLPEASSTPSKVSAHSLSAPFATLDDLLFARPLGLLADLLAGKKRSS